MGARVDPGLLRHVSDLELSPTVTLSWLLWRNV